MSGSSNESLPRFLYKYRSLGPSAKENTLSIIRDNALWASSPSKFNDPFDCMPAFSDEGMAEFIKIRQPEYTEDQISATIARLKNTTHSEHSVIEGIFQKAIKGLGIISLASSCDNFPMWAHYSDNHQGFCIEIDMNIAGSVLDVRDRVYYGEERPVYRHFMDMRKMDKEHLKKIRICFLQKAKEWEYEREWRYFCDIDVKKDGKLVQLPLGSITRIIVGARASDECQREIEDIVKQSDPNIKVVRARLDDKEYKIIV